VACGRRRGTACRSRFRGVGTATLASAAGWAARLAYRNQIGVDSSVRQRGKVAGENAQADKPTALEDVSHDLAVNQMKLVHLDSKRIASRTNGEGIRGVPRTDARTEAALSLDGS
jgi:hypothetical protein